MPLGEHLRELRRRIILSVVGILVAAIAGFFLYPPVFAAMSAPMDELAERGLTAGINFTTLGSPFELRIRVALILGVFLSAPWWIGQLFAFISPGLTRRERRLSIAFGVAGAILFSLGGLLGWFIMPNAVRVLTSFTPEGALALMDGREYFGFFLRVIVVFAVAFLVPLVLVGANVIGVLRGRTMLRGWRWAVLLAFVFGAIANPLPDAWSMIMMAIPICVLYFAAAGVALWNDRRRRRLDAQRDAELLGEA